VKLKSAVFQNALKAAYSSLGMSATYSKAGIGFLSALQGYFLLVLDEVDSAFTLDATVVSFFKSLSDSSEAADVAVMTFYKSLADEGYASDAQVFEFAKSLSDTAVIPEQISKAFEKGYDDPAYPSDEHFHSYQKILSETIGVTDDIDGESSVLDDQEIQFFKVRVDVAHATDTLDFTMAFNRTFTDTASSTDAGSIRNQGYADFTFFAEDYVGASRTFT